MIVFLLFYILSAIAAYSCFVYCARKKNEQWDRQTKILAMIGAAIPVTGLLVGLYSCFEKY